MSSRQPLIRMKGSIGWYGLNHMRMGLLQNTLPTFDQATVAFGKYVITFQVNCNIVLFAQLFFLQT